ncbi:MAG TPA: hypothetical protein VIW45_07090 [Vicinamibacterales bacterium]|jgi:hypothetical protein
MDRERRSARFMHQVWSGWENVVTETPAVARESAFLVWTLLARSIGVAAGMAIALIGFAAIVGAL